MVSEPGQNLRRVDTRCDVPPRNLDSVRLSDSGDDVPQRVKDWHLINSNTSMRKEKPLGEVVASSIWRRLLRRRLGFNNGICPLPGQ